MTLIFPSGSESNFWRLSLAWIILALWAFGWGRGFQGMSFPWFFASGMIGFGFGDIALFKAYARLGSRLTLLMVQCLAAPLGALMEYLWLGTTLTIIQMVCATVILTGVGIALTPLQHEHHTRKDWLTGIGFGFIAALAQAGGAVCSRKAYEVAKLNDFPIDGMSAAFQRITAGILLTGIFLIWINRRYIFHAITSPRIKNPESNQKWNKGKWILLMNALFGPVLGVSCYQWALQTTPSGIVLPIVALTPVVAIPFASRLEGERISGKTVLGSIIAVIGAMVLTIS